MPHGELPVDWLSRLRRSLHGSPDHDPARWQLGGHLLTTVPAAQSLMSATPQAAAVLVPIIDRPNAPSLLLTTRSGQLRHHASQISFPGGRVDVGDANMVAAALRETHEEIGVDSRYIEPLGFLSDHVVLTGFRITPVVALVRPEFTLKTDPAEVADVFEMPLEFLCRGTGFKSAIRVLLGLEVTLNDLHYDGRVVWGATSGILQSLRASLLAP